jgi:N-acetylglucosamine-6-sulfatase
MPRIRTMGYEAVRTARWKYIRYTELQGMDELYDLERDPYEMKNAITDEAAAPLRKELDRLKAASQRSR